METGTGAGAGAAAELPSMMRGSAAASLRHFGGGGGGAFRRHRQPRSRLRDASGSQACGGAISPRGAGRPWVSAKVLWEGMRQKLSASLGCCATNALAAWARQIPRRTPLEMFQILARADAQPGCRARLRASSGSLPEERPWAAGATVSPWSTPPQPSCQGGPERRPSPFSIHRRLCKDQVFLLKLFCNPGKCHSPDAEQSKQNTLPLHR